jgi:spore maturation protein CgeB
MKESNWHEVRRHLTSGGDRPVSAMVFKTKNPEELDKRLHYYIEHEEEAEKIASNAHTFFKKYLWKNDTIQYYMQKLLNEYSKRMTYSPT